MSKIKECEKPNECWMCHKQAGLPILLTRYAVASAKPVTTAELYGKNEEDEPRVVVWDDAAPKLGPSFKVEDKPGHEAVGLGDGARYTLRLLRPGYVYVYNPKDPDEMVWRGYEVTDQQYLEEFAVFSKRPLGRKESGQKLAPCNPDKNEMIARCITIPGAEDAGIVWIGFSDTKWTEHLLKQNENESFRNRHMRRLDVATYMGSYNREHDHAVCVHSLIPEDGPGNGRIAPIIAEYAYRRLIVKKFENKDESFFEEKEEPGVFSFSPVPLQRLGSPNEPFVKLPYEPFLDKKEPPSEDEYNKRMADLQTQIDVAREEEQSILSKQDPSPEQKARLKELGLHINKLQVKRAELDTLYVREWERRHKNPDIAATSDPSGPACRNTEFTQLIRQFKRFYTRKDQGNKSSEKYTGKGMILALDDAPGITMDLAGMMEARLDGFRKQVAFHRAVMVNECLPLAQVATHSYVKKMLDEHEKRLLAEMGKLKKKPEDVKTHDEKALDDAKVQDAERARKDVKTQGRTRPKTLEELRINDEEEALGNLTPTPEAPPEPKKTRLRMTLDEMMNIDGRQSPIQKERVEQMLKLLSSPDKVLQGCESVWEHYRKTHYNEEAHQKFFGRDSLYFKKSIEFGKTAIDPLAEAHKTWFGSDYLIDYFICNFDNTEGKSKTGETKGDKPEESNQIDTVEEQMKEGYRVHSAPYLTLLSLCIGATASHPICKQMYSKTFFGNDTTERNLIWMGLNMNRCLLAEKVKKISVALAAIQKEAQLYIGKNAKVFDSGDDPALSLKFEAADFVAKWAWNGWDAFYNAVKTIIEAFSDHSEAERRLLEAANESYIAARKKYDKLQEAKRIVAEAEALNEQKVKQQKNVDAHATRLQGAEKTRVESVETRNQWAKGAFDKYVLDNLATNRLKYAEETLSKTAPELRKLNVECEQATQKFLEEAKKLNSITANGPKGKFLAQLRPLIDDLVAKQVKAGAFSQTTGHLMLAVSAEAGLPVVVEEFGRPGTVQKRAEKLFGIHGETGPDNVRLSSMFKDLPQKRLQVPVMLQAGPGFMIDSMFPNPISTHWWELSPHTKTIAGKLQIDVAHTSPLIGRAKDWNAAYVFYKQAWKTEYLKQAVIEIFKQRNAAYVTNTIAIREAGEALLGKARTLDDLRRWESELKQLERERTKATADVETARRGYQASFKELDAINKQETTVSIARNKVFRELLEVDRTACEAVDAMNLKIQNMKNDIDFAQFQQKIGAGYAVLNAALAYFVLISWGHELDKAMPMDKKTDEYKKALSMYIASVATFTASLVDSVLAIAIAASRFAWAARLSTTMQANKHLMRFTRVGGAALSAVGAYWDFNAAALFFNEGELGWGFAYGIAGVLGIASSASIVRRLPLHITLTIMSVYAVYTSILYDVSPKLIELWLKRCYFGRSPNESWTGRQELQKFEFASGKQVPKKAETTWQ